MATADVKAPGAGESPPSDSGLYQRKASGLVREIGLRAAFSINISFLNLAGPVAVFPIMLALFPGVDLTWPIIAAGLMTIPLALVYSQLTAAMPRSGGDYVFAGRLFHPALGAMIGFALLIVVAYNAGLSATQLGTVFLPFAFNAIGDALSWSGLQSTSADIATKSGTLWTSLGMMVLAVLAALRGTRFLTRAIIGCVAIGFVGVIVLILNLLFADPSSFQSSFNDASGNAQAYGGILDAARGNGVQLGVVGAALISSLPFAALVYLGSTYTVYPAGEVKRPGKTVLNSVLLAIGGGGLFVIVMWLAYKHAAGLHFLQSASWLGVNDPDAAAKVSEAPLDFGSLSLLVMNDPVSKILVGIGLVAWSFVFQLVAILVVSRILFALSFDRLLPSFVTRVNPRNNTPMVALVVGFAIAVAFMITAIYTGLAVAFRNAILINTTIYVVTSIGGALLPWLRRDLFAASPKPYGPKWGGAPAITVVGVLSTVFFGYIAFLCATKPEISGGYDRTSVIALAFAALSGLVAYFISRMFLRSRGTDLSLALRELPPE